MYKITFRFKYNIIKDLLVFFTRSYAYPNYDMLSKKIGEENCCHKAVTFNSSLMAINALRGCIIKYFVMIVLNGFNKIF